MTPEATDKPAPILVHQWQVDELKKNDKINYLLLEESIRLGRAQVV